MPTDVLMPALSPTMEEGKLSRWLKQEGDAVKSGDVIAEIETDKATMEVEAVDEGVLAKILVPEGAEGVKVNTRIAVITAEGESLSAEAGTQDTADSKATSTAKPDKAAQQASEPEPSGEAPQADATQKNADSTQKNADAAPQDSAPAASDRKSGKPDAAAPKQPTVKPHADLELPDGVKMVKTTVREALRDAMAEEMRRDDAVFVMGEEVAEYQGAYKVTQGLLQEFGARRVVDTPITEHGFAGLGVGAAFAGLRPIVEFMTFNFAMQAIDHFLTSAAKTLYMSGGQITCPIVFRGPNGAAARVGAQHSQDYSSWYSHVPGLTVLAPYTAADAKGLLKSAIRSPNPVVFLENEILYGQSFPVPDVEDWLVPIGKARVAREGAHITLVAWSHGMTYALAAAEQLAADGIEAEVIDLRTLRPLDTETIVTSVRKTGRCVVVEEGWPQAGMGAEISARIMEQAFDYLDAPVTRVSGKDVPMPYAANLEKLALPSTAEVVAAAHAVCYR